MQLSKTKLVDYLTMQSDICDDKYTEALHKGQTEQANQQQNAMLLYIDLINKIENGEFDG